MTQVEGMLTVFFEDPFWVGVYQRREGDRLEVAKVVFGAQPKDYEVYARLLRDWPRLRFSPAQADAPALRHRNPKRLQREIRDQMRKRGVGTKAQQALQQAREAAAVQRKQSAKQRTALAKQQRFACKQDKKKQKHRGR